MPPAPIKEIATSARLKSLMGLSFYLHPNPIPLEELVVTKKIPSLLLLTLLLQIPFSFACEGESTFLIARQNASFSEQGDAWTQEFSLSGSEVQTLILRFAAVYRASAIIIDADDTQAFLNGQAVDYYKGFDNTFGTDSVSLTEGNYALAIRNNNDGANNYSVELDCDKTFANANWIDSHTEATTVSPNGGKLWQPLDVSSGYRLWVDGVNYGLETYLIPESELSAFQNNSQFNYYVDFSSTTSGALPGGYEIDLPEGRYYLAFKNIKTVAMPLTYTIELFDIVGSGSNGGVAIDGKSTFSISGTQLSATIATLANTRNTKTAPLRLLWLASPDGQLNNVYTIGQLDLDELASGDGSLDAGESFNSITLTTAYQPPPYGTYHVILAVVETNNPDQVLDSLTYEPTFTLGTATVSSSLSSQSVSSAAASQISSSTASSQVRSSVSSSSSTTNNSASSVEPAASSKAASSVANVSSGGGSSGGGGAMNWLSLIAIVSLLLMRARPKN